MASLVKNKSKNVQMLYQTVYCLWLLSYNQQVAEVMNDTKVIPNLVEILRIATKEKVIRMTVATLRVCYVILYLYFNLPSFAYIHSSHSFL